MSAATEVMSAAASASSVMFVAIPGGNEKESLIHWPCLQFENIAQMQGVMVQRGRSETEVAKAILRYLQKGGPKLVPVVYLLGKKPPLKAPRLLRAVKEELDAFKESPLAYFTEGQSVPGFNDAWEEAAFIAYGADEDDDDQETDENETTGEKDSSVGAEKPKATDTGSKDATSTESSKVTPEAEHKTPEASIASAKASLPAPTGSELQTNQVAPDEHSHSLEPKEAAHSTNPPGKVAKEKESSSKDDAEIFPTADDVEEECGDGDLPESTQPDHSDQIQEASDTAKLRSGKRKANRVSTDGNDVDPIASPTLESEKTSTAGATKPTNKDEAKTSERRCSSPLAAHDDPALTMTPTKLAKRSNSDKPKSTSKMAKGTKKPRHGHTKVSSGKKTSSTNDDVNDEIAPTFAQVRDLFTKAGYVFRENLYCRPSMDPSTNPNAKLDSDFFKSEAAFRNHLCAYGVNGDINIWDEDEELCVKRWVRYNVVKSVELDGNEFPDYDDVKANKVWTLLKAIGCTYTLTTRCSVYTLPGISKEQAEQGIGSFDEEGDLFTHLSRFGLPDSCDFSQISARDRLNLEMFLAEGVDALEYINDDRKDSQMTKGSGTETTPHGVRRSARKRKNPDGKNMDSLAGVTKALGASAKKESSSRKKIKSASAKKGHSASSNENVGVLGSLSQQPSMTASSVEPMQTVSPIQRNRFHSSASIVSQSPGEQNDNVVPRPETKATDQEKLEDCLEVLRTSHSAAAPCFMNSEDSHFTSNLNKILNFLLSVIRSEGQNGGKKSKNEIYPAALYICGAPGIGKTSGVNYCFNMAIQETANDEDFEEPKRCHINAGHMKSVHSPMKTIVNRMCESLGLKTKSKSNLIRCLKHKTGPVLVVEMDEIDHLISGGNDDKLSAAEVAVNSLLEWANEPDYRLAVIGISNSSGNHQFVRLHDIGKFKETITFKPYGTDDILRILEARVGGKIIAKTALTMIAKKVASSSGDARKALELASDAVKNCLASLRTKSAKSNSKYPLVTMQHLSSSLKVGNKRLTEVVEGLPQVGKVILCVAATLAHADVKTTTIGKLRQFVAECMYRDQVEDMVTLEDFKMILETLADSGLLSFGKAKSNVISSCVASEIFRMPICLSVQLDDVENALSSVLYQNEFYENLREHAKQNKAELQGSS